MEFPIPILIFFLIVIGASFGSFLNVLIYRVPKKMSIVKPRSHCFTCNVPIRALDNIPIVAYFLLGGKCKNCGAEFPSRYAFVEIITALLTIIIFVISLFILTSLLTLSNIDFESSFKLAVLTLMNTVNSSAYGLSDFDFNNLHFLTKYFIVFFMIIGRVELLSLLLIAKKFLFKN